MSVVVARLDDDQFVVAELINEAVFVGDAARPVAGQIMGEALRLADSRPRITRRFLDHAINSPENGAFASPRDIVIPCITRKADLHATSCCGSINSRTLV